MSHGYAKAAGKPMMTLMHGTVGLLHASMGLFQAWADRVPVFATVAHAEKSEQHGESAAQRAGHGRPSSATS